MLLVLVGTIADFAEPVNEDRTCQAVARLALVSSCPVVRRSSGSLIQSRVNRVRSSRPIQDPPAPRRACSTWQAAWRVD